MWPARFLAKRALLRDYKTTLTAWSVTWSRTQTGSRKRDNFKTGWRFGFCAFPSSLAGIRLIYPPQPSKQTDWCFHPHFLLACSPAHRFSHRQQNTGSSKPFPTLKMLSCDECARTCKRSKYIIAALSKYKNLTLLQNWAKSYLRCVLVLKGIRWRLPKVRIYVNRWTVKNLKKCGMKDPTVLQLHA